MNGKSLLRLFVLIFSLCLALTLTSCFGGSDGSGDGGDENTITISIQSTAMAGEKVLLEKRASFDGFYQKEINYEFVGSNDCGAEFVHELDKENNWWNTYVVAKTPGSVSIKLSFTYAGELIESNVVTITFEGRKIATVEDLMNIANSSESYVLANDIDLSSVDKWTPIENFSGTLSGAGYKIINLKVDSTNDENIGLFGILKGTVEDLKIENASIGAKGNAGNAGIVAGTNQGTIKDVSVSGSVSTPYYNNVGGIVGFNDTGIILTCTNEAEVNGANCVGGVAGLANLTKTEQFVANTNKGAISGSESVGGIVGMLTNPTKKTSYTLELADFTNEGQVTGKDKVGGVFGSVYGMSYNSSYQAQFILSVLTNSADVSGSGDYVGGLIGHATRLVSLAVGNNTASVSGGNYVGGFVGYAPNTTIMAGMATNSSTITGKGYVGGFAGYAGLVENAINEGNVISSAMIVEENVAMAYVGGIAGYCTGIKGCENNSDITVTHGGKYVGGIAGYVTVSSQDMVEDNKNTGAIIASDNVGGIAGILTNPTKKNNNSYSVSSFENLGTVTGKNKVGGIFGEVYGMYYSSSYSAKFEISLMTNSADVTATGDYVGGLIGYAERVAVISVSTNAADITTNGKYVGGFVGYAPHTHIQATGATNESTITGGAYIGGFAGYVNLIENATNNGTVISSSTTTEDGVAKAYVGGIAGYCIGVKSCVNNSDINVTTGGAYVGGIAGYVKITATEMVKENQNSGNISGSDNVGGIAGYVGMETKKSNPVYACMNNKNYGDVSGATKVGGIFGEVYAMYYSSSYKGSIEVTYCQNEGTVSGTSYVGGVVGYQERMNLNPDLVNTNTTVSGEIVGAQ